MPTSPSFYELSLAVESDLGDIFGYTFDEFGLEQAETYTLDFESTFEAIVQNPELGKERNEIKLGVRSILKGSHIIFYRILEDRIRIVRILHQRKDIMQFSELG